MTLLAVSPIDGRYQTKTEKYQQIFSEYGLIYFRWLVEIRWFEQLSQEVSIPEVPVLSAQTKNYLQQLIDNFSIATAENIKAIEATTNHDVKAVEYELKNQFQKNAELAPLTEFIHFACTSEDINNLAYSLMVKQGLQQVILPDLNNLQQTLINLAEKTAFQPMLSRTHGQAATPTTAGKEIANFAYRLTRQINALAAHDVFGKINGAVGNFNAHYAAYPDTNWPELAKNFVENLGLEWNPYTTQIEPHDGLAELFNRLTQINTVLLDFSKDMWAYISIDYFGQKPKDGEIGSSTMPHKVNPIDFENAEGNLGLANALLQHFAIKLPISRWQRDLTDSTVLRNVGVAFAHCTIAYQALLKGCSKLAVNNHVMDEDLNSNWEVLAEALQTVMRKYHIEKPYEQLKELTRGKKVNQQQLQHFIKNLPLPHDVKTQLKAMTPQTYIGNAGIMAKKLTNG